jgi:ribosomal protein S14
MKSDSTTSSGREPCIGCGEETAIGSTFYSDRRVVDRPDGTRIHLCSLCGQRAAAQHRKKQLTDEEVRILAQSGSLMDIVHR